MCLTGVDYFSTLSYLPAISYFEWSEGNPLAHLMRYLLLGRGDTPPVVREIIRQNETDPARRPRIHVG